MSLNTILGFGTIEADFSTFNYITIQRNQQHHTNQRSKKKRSETKRFKIL